MNLTTETAALEAAAVWCGLLLLLLVALSFQVVLARRAHKVGVGDGGVEPLGLRARAFGNAAEYAGPMMAALILLALVDFTPWLIHGLGAAFLLGRLLHAWGISQSSGVTVGRAAGISLTWIAYLVAAVALLFCAVT